jgi:cobalt-zinc-cadmium efflux system outer membrane protein
MKNNLFYLAAAMMAGCCGCAADSHRRSLDRLSSHASHVSPVETQGAEKFRYESPVAEAAVIPVSGLLDDNASGDGNVVVAAVDTIPQNVPIEPPLAISNGMTLEQLVTLALNNNPAVKELVATTQKAAGYRTQVGLYANPTFGYQGQQLADRGTDQHTIFAEQEFVTAGKLDLNRRVQNEALRAQLQELEAQKLRVATDIQTLYYRALGYQKQLDLISEFRGLMDKGYELAQLRLKASEGSKIDVLQTKVQRNEIDLAYRQTQARYDAAWREITAIAGIQGLTPTTLVSEFPVTSETLSWDSVASTIVASSPEYAASQSRISQARAELERHGVQAVPNITTQVAAGYDNGTNSGMMNLQVGLPIPVFNKNQGNIAAARAEYCRALMEAKRIENAIRARLAIVSSDFETSLEAVNVYGADILPGAREALTLAETAYKAGEMDFIQLLVARRTYFESNLQYVNAQAQLASARAKVDGFVLSGSLDAVIDRSGSDSLRGLTFGQK